MATYKEKLLTLAKALEFKHPEELIEQDEGSIYATGRVVTLMCKEDMSKEKATMKAIREAIEFTKEKHGD